LLLSKEFFGFKWKFDAALWRELMIYGMPLIIAGFAGMINETFDRIMLGWWAPAGTHEEKMQQVGIYSACYKLSLLITLFIQAFRMGAEPFFFQQARGEDAPKTYARVMKFFVITICVMFLAVTLYLDIWKQFIRNRHMWVGLSVVPILLIANMSLGVYYNLSIWYKLSHNTRAGATITIIGAVLTLIVNYLFIPHYGYMACAWATLICYASMMVISYFWGQRVYRVPYATKKLIGFFSIMLLFYYINMGLRMITPIVWIHLVSGTVFLFLYLRFVYEIERKELKKMPLIGKWVK